MFPRSKVHQLPRRLFQVRQMSAGLHRQRRHLQGHRRVQRGPRRLLHPQWNPPLREHGARLQLLALPCTFLWLSAFRKRAGTSNCEKTGSFLFIHSFIHFWIVGWLRPFSEWCVDSLLGLQTPQPLPGRQPQLP